MPMSYHSFQGPHVEFRAGLQLFGQLQPPPDRNRTRVVDAEFATFTVFQQQSIKINHGGLSCVCFSACVCFSVFSAFSCSFLLLLPRTMQFDRWQHTHAGEWDFVHFRVVTNGTHNGVGMDGSRLRKRPDLCGGG